MAGRKRTVNFVASFNEVLSHDVSNSIDRSTERLHAAGTASAVLLRIILTERDREIAGPGWCVDADGLGREPASDGNRTALGQIGEESTG